MSIEAIQDINIDAYFSREYGEHIIGNLETECPECKKTNRPYRKKEKPEALSQYMEKYKGGYWYSDLATRWKTSCSSCGHEYEFRLVYPQ